MLVNRTFCAWHTAESRGTLPSSRCTGTLAMLGVLWGKRLLIYRHCLANGHIIEPAYHQTYSENNLAMDFPFFFLLFWPREWRHIQYKKSFHSQSAVGQKLSWWHWIILVLQQKGGNVSVVCRICVTMLLWQKPSKAFDLVVQLTNNGLHILAYNMISKIK